MAIKDLLIAYQGDEGSKNALRFALQMAKKYDASLTGAYVYSPEQNEGQLRHWIGDDFVKTMRQVQMEAVSKIEASFHDFVLEHAPEVRHEWVSATGPAGITLARLSRTFDLLITGQFEGAIRVGGRSVQPEELLLRAGKPVLMIPKNYNVRPFREEAVVAWDGSRYAARAHRRHAYPRDQEKHRRGNGQQRSRGCGPGLGRKPRCHQPPPPPWHRRAAY